MQGKPRDYAAKYRPGIAAVTKDDVKRVAAKYLKPDSLVFVIVGKKDALLKGTAEHPGKFEQFGKVHDFVLPDPLTGVVPSKAK